MSRTLPAAVLALLSATALPALAQDAAITRAGGEFTTIPGVYTLFQTNGDGNVFGGAQTSALPDLRFSQTGFYNRGVIVQTGALPIGVVVQNGTFDRALILQTAGGAQASLQQNGAYNSGFVVQFGAGNSSFLAQNGTGAVNGAFVGQDATASLPLSPDDTRTLVTNFLYAPETVRAPAEMLELGGVAFVDSLLARRSGAPGTCAAYFQGCEGLAAYGAIDHADGDQDGRLGALGFDHRTTGVTLGLELPATPELTAGLALRYQRSEASVANGFADVDADSYGGAVYGDWRREGFFATGLAFYLRDELDVRRAGIGGTAVTASPDGDTFGGALRAGYLFPLGTVEAGPLVGYTQVRSELDGYSEGGSPFLAQSAIPGQAADARLGLVGARISLPGSAGLPVTGTLDVAYERDFESDDFAAQRTEFAFAPGVGAFTPVAAIGDLDYLHLAGNATVDLTNGFALDLSAGGRWSESRDSWRIGAELRKGF